MVYSVNTTLVAQSVARPTDDQRVAGPIPDGSGNIFVEIDHGIFSTVILSLLLIQEGQLSISGEKRCASTGQPLRGLSLTDKSTDRLGMTFTLLTGP